MLEDADSARSLPQNRRDFRDIELTDDAQENDLRLIGRDFAQPHTCRLGFTRGDGHFPGSTRPPLAEDSSSDAKAARLRPVAPTEVDEPPMGDRKQPAAEGCFVALRVDEVSR